MWARMSAWVTSGHTNCNVAAFSAAVHLKLRGARPFQISSSSKTGARRASPTRQRRIMQQIAFDFAAFVDKFPRSGLLALTGAGRQRPDHLQNPWREWKVTFDLGGNLIVAVQF